MDELTITTQSAQEFIDITKELRELLLKSHIKNGICIATTLHTTAGLTINENADINVTKDISEFLYSQIPPRDSYKHLEGNTPAHIKTSLFGSSLTVIIDDGDFVLGVWQAIYFCEFDGPRVRKVKVKFMKG